MAEASKLINKASDEIETVVRPGHRQSEIDVGKDLGEGWRVKGGEQAKKTNVVVEDIAKNTSNAAHNSAALKLDLKTTEAANEVVESLRNTGQLPQHYVNKRQAAANGWKPGKALNNTTPGGQLGGDIFENSTNVLPSAQGRVWREADIRLNNTMSRSNQPGTRLLYSNDGLLYITTDHYETATSIGKWK